MSKTNFKHAKVSGITVVVPEKEINIYDEVHYYGNDVKKVDRMRKMVGVHKRRVVDDRTTAADLGIEAARILIEEMKINICEIDALVFVVQEPDFANPATAFYIHKELKLTANTPAFDINMGCAGFVYGMWMASQMIESKACKKVLLICADTPARGMNLDQRSRAPLFGDGGVATLVEYSQETIDSFYNIETKSDGFEALIKVMTGNRVLPPFANREAWDWFSSLKDRKVENTTGEVVGLFDTYMDGMAVFDFTVTIVPQNIKELMDFAKVEEKEIVMLLLHQANKQIVQAVGTGAGFPTEKVPYYAFENFGNNTMCSIPTHIATVLKERSESSKIKILASAFGNGLTCASCVLNLNGIYNSGIRTYISPPEKPTRHQLAEYWLNKMKGT